MENKRIGRQTVVFSTPPRIVSASNIVGDMEGEGPLGSLFDMVIMDDTWGEKSWEKAECKMFEECVRQALNKVNWQTDDLNCLLGGDLLNQIISINFAARQLGIPFFGLYGACSTMAESLLIGAMLTDGGFVQKTACIAGSHFSTAERQFRFPLEMGTTSPPTAQRTVTGVGSVLLADASCAAQVKASQAVYSHIAVTGGTIGKVVDLGITDANNMGAAMAPAACDTILTHLKDMDRKPSDYDHIITGDLGAFGTEMLLDLCNDEGIDISHQHKDCGSMIFFPKQNVNSGGSGCGCSAVTLTAYWLPLLEQGRHKRVLFLATGALMSPTSSQQSESIPGIAHAVVIEHQ